jgi:hypothetical protein
MGEWIDGSVLCILLRVYVNNPKISNSCHSCNIKFEARKHFMRQNTIAIGF